MMKKSFIGLAVTTALVAAVPYGLGVLTEKQLKQSLPQLEPQQLKVEVIDYQRGYAQSQLQTEMTLLDPLLIEQFTAEGLPTTWRVNTELNHDFLGIASHSTLVDAPQLPLALTTHTNFLGKTEFEVDFEPLVQQRALRNPQLTLKAPMLVGDFTLDGQVHYQFSLQELSATNYGAKNTLSEVVVEGDLYFEQQLLLGTQTINVDHFLMLDAAGGVDLSIKDISFTAGSALDQTKQFFTIQLKGAMSELTGRNLPIENDLDKVSFAMQLAGLERQAIEQLVEYSEKPQLLEQNPQLVMDTLDQLLTQGMHFSLDQFSVKNIEGELNSTLNLTLPQGEHHSLNNPLVLISALQGQSNSFIDNQLLEHSVELKQMILFGEQQQWLMKEPTGYRLKLALANGNITYGNNQQLPLLNLFLGGFGQ